MAVNVTASATKKAAAKPYAPEQPPTSAQPARKETPEGVISADERERMIRDAAYFRYQQGGCVEGRGV